MKRRTFLTSLLCAPTIVRASSLDLLPKGIPLHEAIIAPTDMIKHVDFLQYFRPIGFNPPEEIKSKYDAYFSGNSSGNFVVQCAWDIPILSAPF